MNRHWVRTVVLFFGVLVSVLGAQARADSAQELPDRWRNWTHFRAIEIDVEEPSVLRLPVPEALLAAAEADLKDVRVIDDLGESVGYVLYAQGRGPETKWRATPLLDTGEVPGKYTQVVADTGTEGVQHSFVEVSLGEISGEVFVWVEVAASDDRETWRVVRQRAPALSFSPGCALTAREHLLPAHA